MWPLHNAAATRTLEQAAASTLPAHALMERAGESLARLALAVAPHARAIDLWCGPGNNGGDGFVAARLLQAWGKTVRVVAVGAADRRPLDAAYAWQRAFDAGVPMHASLPEHVLGDLAVDALLGIGGQRALSGELASAVERLNAGDAPVLAADVPTGLHGDSGGVLGMAVHATHTLSLLTLKPGLFTAHGRDHVGRVWFDDLDVDGGDSTLQLSGPAAALALAAPRDHAHHKGSFGDAVVIGGAAGMAGAAVLAARAAGAAGAGRTYLGLLSAPVQPWLDPMHPELMSRPLAQLLEPSMLAHAAVVCGCGGGDPVREVLPALLHRAPRLVLDADALNAIAADGALQRALRARAERGLQTVLTPHPLEAARLLSQSTHDVQADRVRAARALSDAMACTVLLKGSGSVIATPGQATSINPSGDARLGTAGSGDVLAGWLGGCWAAAASRAITPHALAQGVAWLHGDAVAYGPIAGPLCASALIGAMVRARDALVAHGAPA